MDNAYRRDQLRDAQLKLQEIVDIVEEVFPDDAYIEQYFINKLKIRVGDGHGFLTTDPNFDTLMAMINNEMEEMEDPEDE